MGLFDTPDFPEETDLDVVAEAAAALDRIAAIMTRAKARGITISWTGIDTADQRKDKFAVKGFTAIKELKL